MTNPSPAWGGPRWPGAVLAAVVMLAGVRMITGDDGRTDGPPRPAAADTAALGAAATPKPAVRSLPPSPPTRIEIPEISVDAPLTGLGRESDDSLQTPPAEEANLAGWDQAGVTPGSTGTAVVAGHVDTRTGPAVFYGLGALHKNAKVSVTRDDGRIADFTVDAVEEYEKDEFPSEQVYRQATRAELRLITCGGAYSKKNGYSGNTVVYAHLTKVR
ncbi:class F sortase [Streptomyces sp. NBC_00370]|uniref:class F sortase n=1 Tax=Streptomyces sp. NBC_00370 TaxID=2975728 RepID=UPI002E263856